MMSPENISLEDTAMSPGNHPGNTSYSFDSDDVRQDHVPSATGTSNQVQGYQGPVSDSLPASTPDVPFLSRMQQSVEKSRSNERLSQGHTHPTQPVQGDHFRRPDMDDGENLLAAFEFGTPPSKKPAFNHQGIARGSQSFTAGAPHLVNMEASYDDSEAMSKRPPVRNHLKEMDLSSTNPGDDLIGRKKNSLQGPTSHEMPPPSTQEKSFIMQEPRRPAKQLPFMSTSVIKRAQNVTAAGSPRVSNMGFADKIADGSPNRPVDESRYEAQSLRSSQSPSQRPSEPGTRTRSRLRNRLEQHPKRRVSTPIPNNKLPKQIAATRQKALILRKSPSPRRRTPQTQLAGPLGQPKQMRRNGMAFEKQKSEICMPPPPRPTHREVHIVRDDLAFHQTRTRHGAAPHASNVERGSAIHRQSQASPSSQSTETMRPDSQASNISRPRDPVHNPSRKLSDHARQKHRQKLAKLTEKWNDFFTCNKTSMELQDHTIASLGEAVEEKDATIQEYQLKTETYEAENDQLRNSNQQLESDLAESAQRVSVLEEKLGSYRQRLGNAINEQQQLYTRCKEKCRETIAQLKEEKQDYKASIDEELAASNSSKLALQEKVASVVEEARKNAQERKLHLLFISDDIIDKF